METSLCEGNYQRQRKIEFKKKFQSESKAHPEYIKKCKGFHSSPERLCMVFMKCAGKYHVDN